jgi:hypothetical protein
LDKSIRAVLSSIKQSSAKTETDHLPRRVNSQSCLIRGGDGTESTSSFISYKKNKYSTGRLSMLLQKSPRTLNVLEDISNNQVKGNLINQFNQAFDCQTGTKDSKSDKIEKISAKQMSEKETAENNEYSEHFIESSNRSSMISESYQSFSTVVNERSMETYTEEELHRPSVAMKNPFL